MDVVADTVDGAVGHAAAAEPPRCRPATPYVCAHRGEVDAQLLCLSCSQSQSIFAYIHAVIDLAGQETLKYFPGPQPTSAIFILFKSV